MTKKTGRGGATPYYYIHARRGRRREGGEDRGEGGGKAEGRRRGLRHCRSLHDREEGRGCGGTAAYGT